MISGAAPLPLDVSFSSKLIKIEKVIRNMQKPVRSILKYKSKFLFVHLPSLDVQN